MKKLVGLLFIVLSLTVSSVLAGNITFSGKTDKNPLEYQPGEEMVFTVQCLDDGQPVDGVNLSWKRTGDDGKTESGSAVSSASEPLTIKTSIDIPGFVRIQVFPCDAKGKIIGGEHDEPCQFNGGAAALVDQIKGYPEPEDFDAFWDRQKEILARVPVRAWLKPLESSEPGVVGYEVMVDNSSLTPVSGYLFMPKNAKEKSLPAEVYYQGYCVLPTSKTFDKGKDRIYLTINCHGFLNDQVEEYYDTMRQTFLRNYGFSEEQNNNPDSCYWCGMMMRGLRALQYVKTLPEWDGVNLITSGVSQGGMQCLTIAGLDPDVTEVHAVIPWFCDVSGAEKNGRIDSWFMPRWVDGLGYFDTTNHAKRIRGKVEIYAGLGDYVSPPSGVAVLYNSIKSEVKLQFRQGRTHEFEMPDSELFSLEKPAE
ncbi:MAG: acetylxylan esterase [Thermoguttaceae bacterium]|jgi:cephalosporin-C deacetylase